MIEQVTETQIQEFIQAALHEDVRDGDHTSLACISPTSRDKARLLVKGNGILAGLELAKAIFKAVDPSSTIEIFKQDGDAIKYGEIAFIVECGSQALLKAERLVLNTMQRMSGIATMSHQYAAEVEDLKVQVLDTRKTTPLIRFLEKWAVRIGGATNYRYGLYDWIMIKDNHVDACGGIVEAIERANTYLKETKKDLDITVEVRNLEELSKVLGIGQVRRIMLDNFELDTMREAVAMIGDKFEAEASGGVTMKTLRAIAETGVDFISVGALTHSYESLDLSLKVIKD